MSEQTEASAVTIPDHIQPVLTRAAGEAGLADHYRNHGIALNQQLTATRTEIEQRRGELANTQGDLETARALVAQLEADQDRLTGVLESLTGDETWMCRQLADAGRAELAAAKARDSLRRGAVAMAEMYGVTPEQLEAAEPAPIPPQIPASSVRLDDGDPLNLAHLRPDQRPVDGQAVSR